MRQMRSLQRKIPLSMSRRPHMGSHVPRLDEGSSVGMASAVEAEAEEAEAEEAEAEEEQGKEEEEEEEKEEKEEQE